MYTEKSREIATEEIGVKLEYMYGCEHNVTGSTHIDYFYLFVQAVIREEKFDKKQVKIKDEKVHSLRFRRAQNTTGLLEISGTSSNMAGNIFWFFSKGIK